MKEHEAIIFTDGASRGNPGAGGWGAVIVFDSKSPISGGEEMGVVELGGGEPRTTNNRMELMGAIEALSFLVSEERTKAVLYTDSSYLINGITKWIHGWKKKNWKTMAKEDVLNRDLWETLSKLAHVTTIRWVYVRGHAGASGNERCDVIATACADGARPSLYRGTFTEYPIQDILRVETKAVSAGGNERRKAKAYSYVSQVGGKIETHKTWKECEARVKGTRGARYKKALDVGEEKALIEEWS